MRKHSLFILLLLWLLLISFPTQAQELFSSRYNITYVTMNNGLLHNFIDDIYKDHRGFLWLSTAGGGLSRYDGYEFVHYNTSTPRTKLKSNFIRNVCEDAFGRLWIASEGGTDILDLSSLQLIIPLDKQNKIAALLNQPGIGVITDSRKNIWLCCGSSLHKIVFDEKGDIANTYALTSIPLLIPSVALQDVDEDGNIWMGFGNEVRKVTAEESGILRTTIVSPRLKFEVGTFISVFKAKENEVWIGTDRGLFRYNKSGDLLKHYQHTNNDHRSLSQNYITDLAITGDKQLIVATLKGANIYNPITDSFEQIAQEGLSTGNKLNSNFVNCLLVDGNIIWYGTETGGINKMTPRRLSVHNFSYQQDNSYSLSRNPVNAIYEDMKENLWVGTVEGGLNKKIKNENRFQHYTTEAPSRLSHNSVSAITADGRNHLWVGTWGGGINLLDLNHADQQVIKYISSKTHPGFPIDFIGSLCYDPINKGMWVGANQGIYFYDFATERFISPFANKAGEKVHGCIGAIIDGHDQLWMGCMEGVYMINLHSFKKGHFAYKYLKYKLDEPNSRLVEKISCFFLTVNGTLWIGSNGYGIYKCVETGKNSYKFVSYTTAQGLANNSIRGILEDSKGSLWISTNNGLSCMDSSTGRFTNFSTDDGLASNQFYWNAYCKAKDGNLYFGGLEGLVSIGSEHLQTKPFASKVTFTKLRILNEEVLPGNDYIDTDISTAKIIHLHEKDKSFSLEFAALNFDPQSTAVYSYRLLGFEENWVEVPANRRFASYTNLQPGTYTLQVKYASEGDSSDSQIAELTIVVEPFFYKTTGFILLMIFIIGMAVYQVYKWRIRTLQQQKLLLHKTVEKRTRELEKQKEVLENQTIALSRQNNLLTQQNEKITRQKKQLIQMSKKVQELTMDKLAFFTNITHEFRTPITLIIGPIERALKLSSNPQVIEQLHFVERNSKYLLSLINQLMDFRKIESGKLEIVASTGNFVQFIDALIVPFEAFAGERNIIIRKYIRLSSPEFQYDEDAMRKVITNLLSNAIKFTPNGGTVSLYVASIIHTETKKEQLYICVSDTGSGVPKEDLEQIFNRFYQSREHIKFPVYGQSGTGIGLYLCKRIVQLHEGTITVRNNRKVGCSFRMQVPLSRAESSYIALVPPNSGNAPQQQVDQNLQKSDLTKTLGRLTMLVVEDNKDMRAYIRSILTDKYHVMEAENGVEALAVLGDYNIDFIISDLMMPVMDGMELSRKVKENFAISHIPFLMLTAKTAKEARIESFRIGVDEYLLKPFDEELLLARINNILENRKRYQRQFSFNMEVDQLQMDEESNDKKFLDKMMEVIKENYKNSYYEVSDLIEAMGVSKSLLNKKMQSLTGQSAGQFIRNYRLNIARELIIKNRITKNMNISEIAYEVGFNDPKYFTRCFTKHFNIPPSSLLEEKESL